jgi:peroxiredoxin Q/BCP
MELKKGTASQILKQRHNGNDFDSQMLIGQKPLVIYFYPKDNTQGVPHRQFSDQYEDWIWVQVIGISSDSVDSHQNSQNSINYLYFLSDHDKKIRKL